MKRGFSVACAVALLGATGLGAGEPAGPPGATRPDTKAILLDVPDGLQPVIEEVPGLGTVDWTRGVALAQARAEVKRASQKMLMLRMAKVRAMRNALALLGQMRIDHTRTLQRLADERRTINLRGFISQFSYTIFSQFNH